VAELRHYQRETIDDFECLVAAGVRFMLDFDVALRTVPR
jgi:hypothetical protein